jgi:hypothetical protein
MNWSAIEDLMIEPITDEHMAKLPPILHSLRRLETTNASFVYELRNDTLTHLTYIESSNKEGYSAKELPKILAHQGKSLKSLEVRSPELSNSAFENMYDVKILPQLADGLEHVTLNIARNGTWPLETFATLASMPQLQSADMYMGIQSWCAQHRPLRESVRREVWKRDWAGYCVGVDQYQQPFVGKQGAEEVFAYMRKEKQGVEFTNLTIYIGDWSRGWIGPLYFPDWLKDKSSKVVCSVEGGEDKCVVEQADRYWEWSDRDWAIEEDRLFDLRYEIPDEPDVENGWTS